MIPLALLAAVNAGFAPLHHHPVNSLPFQDIHVAAAPVPAVHQMQEPAVHPEPIQPASVASEELVSIHKTILKTVQVGFCSKYRI